MLRKLAGLRQGQEPVASGGTFIKVTVGLGRLYTEPQVHSEDLGPFSSLHRDTICLLS